MYKELVIYPSGANCDLNAKYDIWCGDIINNKAYCTFLTCLLEYKQEKHRI